MIYAFREFEVDDARCEVRRRGVEIDLRRKAFEVLVYLLRHPQRLISKQELLERVWKDTAVCESSLANCISEIRAALGDRRHGGYAIQTVYGRGYRFVAKLRPGRPSGRSVRSEQGEVEPSGDSPRQVFVGRRQGLERLERALVDSLAGTGRVVLLLGEYGVGKSRLAEHFAERAVERGARVLVARGGRERAPALWPWIDMLRRHCSGRELEQLCASVGTRVEEILGAIAEPPAAPSASRAGAPGEAGALRARCFQALRVYLARLSQRTGCLIVFDDLQQADPSSLAVLRMVARELRAERLFLLGILDAIPRSRAHPLARLVSDLEREAAAETIRVAPFTEAEVEHFVRRVRGHPPPAELVSALHARTEGNPLFLREFVELIEGAGDSRAVASTLPTGVRASIAGRLDGLDPACRRILEVASVAGREFSDLQVQRVAAVDPAECRDGLERAVAAGVVCESSAEAGPATHRFAHGLVRDVLYEGLPGSERARIHRRTARELEARRADVGEIAVHLARSDVPRDLERAVELAARAGRRAARRGAHHQAALHYERALSALDALRTGDPRQRCDLLLGYSGALRWSHRYGRAREVLSQAIDLARSIGAVDRLAAAVLVGSAPDTFGTIDQGRILLVEEVQRAIPAEETEMRIYLEICRIAARWSVDDRERTRAAVRALLAWTEQLQHAPGRVASRLFLHASLQGAEELAQRREVAREALRIAAAQPNRTLELVTRLVLLGDLVEEGDAAGLDREIEIMQGIATSPDDFALRSATGLRALLRGELLEAERGLARVWAETQLWPRGVPCPPGFACQLFALRREQGRLAELESLIRAGRAQMPGVGPWRALLALLLLETGRAPEAARELADLFAEGVERLPQDEFWLGGLVYLSEVVAALDAKPYAARLAGLLEPFGERMATMRYYACVDPVGLALARLALARGWRRRARMHLEAAHALALRLRASPSLARVERVRAAVRARAAVSAP